MPDVLRHDPAVHSLPRSRQTSQRLPSEKTQTPISPSGEFTVSCLPEAATQTSDAGLPRVTELALGDAALGDAALGAVALEAAGAAEVSGDAEDGSFTDGASTSDVPPVGGFGCFSAVEQPTAHTSPPTIPHPTLRMARKVSGAAHEHLDGPCGPASARFRRPHEPQRTAATSKRGARSGSQRPSKPSALKEDENSPFFSSP